MFIADEEWELDEGEEKVLKGVFQWEEGKVVTGKGRIEMVWSSLEIQVAAKLVVLDGLAYIYTGVQKSFHSHL